MEIGWSFDCIRFSKHYSNINLVNFDWNLRLAISIDRKCASLYLFNTSNTDMIREYPTGQLHYDAIRAARFLVQRYSTATSQQIDKFCHSVFIQHNNHETNEWPTIHGHNGMPFHFSSFQSHSLELFKLISSHFEFYIEHSAFDKFESRHHSTH